MTQAVPLKNIASIARSIQRGDAGSSVIPIPLNIGIKGPFKRKVSAARAFATAASVANASNIGLAHSW
ncbi:MAG: hypothetical protein J0H83_13560 [Candidatus Melainabacteria bacterium]|nr:hypothetical protein [Candidatus Melainabacteria bacterium]